MLINNTGKVVEFMVGGKIIIFQPGESRILEGFEAYMALKTINTGLEEANVKVKAEPKKEEKPQPEKRSLEDMKWNELRNMRDEDDNPYWVIGMDREELIETIKEKRGF